LAQENWRGDDTGEDDIDAYMFDEFGILCIWFYGIKVFQFSCLQY
jgi:hypothetical protein